MTLIGCVAGAVPGHEACRTRVHGSIGQQIEEVTADETCGTSDEDGRGHPCALTRYAAKRAVEWRKVPEARQRE